MILSVNLTFYNFFRFYNLSLINVYNALILDKPHINLYAVTSSIANQSLNTPTGKNRVALFENESVELVCNVDAIPNNITYKWFFEDVKLNWSKSSFELKHVTRNNTGKYVCRAQNDIGYTDSEIRVDVICNPF